MTKQTKPKASDLLERKNKDSDNILYCWKLTLLPYFTGYVSVAVIKYSEIRTLTKVGFALAWSEVQFITTGMWSEHEAAGHGPSEVRVLALRWVSPLCAVQSSACGTVPFTFWVNLN